MNKIVKRIDELRKMKGLTKKELMRKMGVSPSTCNSWYYSDITPSLLNIENVCIALEIKEDQFFSGMDNVNNKSEQKFLDYWRMLSDTEKALIKNVIEALKAIRKVQND